MDNSIMVFNLATCEENYYSATIPRKQALKTSYALSIGLGSQLAINFQKVMNDLEKEIIETKNCFSIHDFTIRKEKLTE